MPINIPAATITNTVKYKTDLQSLRKVIADIKRVQKASTAAMSGLAASPAKAQESIRKARQQATQLADAQVSAYRNTLKAKAAQGAQNKQSNWDMLFGMNHSGKSARESASVFAADLKQKSAQAKLAREEAKREFNIQRAESAAYREAAKRDQMGMNRRNNQRSLVGVTESNFGFSGGRTGADVTTLTAYENKLKQLGKAYTQNKINAREYTAASRRLLTQLKDEARQAQVTAYGFKDLKHEMLGIGAFMGMDHFLHSIVETGKQFQTMHSTMATAFGKDAQTQMRYVEGLADEMGIKVSSLSKEYASFAYSALKVGISQKNVEQGFRAITVATTAFGLPQEKVDHVMLAFREIAGEGQLYKRQLNQLAYQLPGIKEAFAEAFDPKLFSSAPEKAIEKLNAAMKGGLPIAKLLPQVFDQMMKNYGGNLQNNIHNLANEQQRLSNQWSYWKEVAFTGGVGDAMKRVDRLLMNMLVVTRPLAAFIGGVALGFSDLTYELSLGIAYLEDYLADMGLIDKKTGFWKTSALQAWRGVGEEVGKLVGIFLGVKMLKMFGKLTGLIRLFKALKGAAAGAAAAEAIEGVGGGGAGGAAKKAGKGLGSMAKNLGSKFGLAAYVAIAYGLGELVFNKLIPAFEKMMGWDPSKTSHGGNTVEGSFWDKTVNWGQGKGWKSSADLPSNKTKAAGASHNFVPPSANYNPYARNGQQQTTVKVNISVDENGLSKHIKAQIADITSDIMNSGAAK